MRLIVISPSYDMENEIGMLETMFRAGLETFHLRKPNYTSKDYETYLDRVNPKFHSRIVLHSRHKMAMTYDLKGLHVSKNHRKTLVRTFFRIFKYRFKSKTKLDISTNYSSLKAFEKTKFGYSYILLSPMFSSVSKKGKKGNFNFEKVRKALKENTKYQMIGSGGVDQTKIEKLFRMGFDGVAIMGGIWEKEDPIATFEECKVICSNLKR